MADIKCSKEDFELFFISKRISISDMLLKFNLDIKEFLTLRKDYGLCKSRFLMFNEIKDLISKEFLESIYYNELYTLTEQMSMWGITVELFHKLREYYGIPLRGQHQLPISKLRKRNAYFNKTEEERNIRNLKIGETERNTWANKTKEEMGTISLKRSQAYESQTEDFKIAKSKYKKEWWESLTSEYIEDMVKRSNLKKSQKSCEEKEESLLKKLKSQGVIIEGDFLSIFFDRDKAIDFLSIKQFTPFQLAKKFGVSPPVIYNWISRLDLKEHIRYYSSSAEEDIKNILRNYNLKFRVHVRNLLSNHRELDFYLPDLKLGIEFNGTHWHGFNQLQDKNYHFNKSKECEQLGIRLIHIWEYEWNDPFLRPKLESLLNIALDQTPSKIYARNCSIKEITNKEAKPFNEKNHLQGHRNAQITYGLYYKDELVQLMSFSKTRYNRNLKTENSWEIIRGCPGSNNIVVGGVSKLFKHFIREHNPDQIFSYCDFNKFDGRGYEAIGMKFIGYTGPDMKYVIDKKVVNRCPSNYKFNRDNCTDKLYGAGSKKYMIVIKKGEISDGL